jgi:hypothetical protein
MKIEVSGSVVGLCMLVGLLVFSPGFLSQTPSMQTHSDSSFNDSTSDRVTPIPNPITEGKADAESRCERENSFATKLKTTADKPYPVEAVALPEAKNKSVK